MLPLDILLVTLGLEGILKTRNRQKRQAYLFRRKIERYLTETSRSPSSSEMYRSRKGRSHSSLHGLDRLCAAAPKAIEEADDSDQKASESAKTVEKKT